MQFLSISKDTTLAGLNKLVGSRNVDSILNANSLERKPNVGKQLYDKQDNIAKAAPSISTLNEQKAWAQRQASVLNTLTSDSDIFEAAALASVASFYVLSQTGVLPGYLCVPESIKLSDSVDVLGNNQPVPRVTYDKTIQSLQQSPYTIDTAAFGEFSSRRNSQVVNVGAVGTPIQWFNLPWGKITLMSSIDGKSMDFPVFPEELSDGVKSTYDTMPELLYQYEPWQLYKSSGPRSNSYTFKFHRDMWSGDHRDGKANELIRFCEANCYPEFKGAAVNTSICSLYIAGTCHISGILTEVQVSWSGPIGLDDWYLMCELQITITEVAKEPLNYGVVSKKGLIE